ncbi:tbc1 domain family member 2b [Stylonychia lemnae]|uniref:Tbc1 domain family member 2b n=1 Tax=Stylonychia lemnae TaxID=5949 RepID=A0A078AS23_STYLE|nr:tbc1 domain family member 2b [Stylonychia lemnae]|eukprot:CDW84002.1 tbc1 domain family member 2b [Stylonychia lemnae]
MEPIREEQEYYPNESQVDLTNILEKKKTKKWAIFKKMKLPSFGGLNKKNQVQYDPITKNPGNYAQSSTMPSPSNSAYINLNQTDIFKKKLIGLNHNNKQLVNKNYDSLKNSYNSSIYAQSLQTSFQKLEESKEIQQQKIIHFDTAGDDAMTFQNDFLKESIIQDIKRPNRPITGFKNQGLSSHFSLKPSQDNQQRGGNGGNNYKLELSQSIVHKMVNSNLADKNKQKIQEHEFLQLKEFLEENSYLTQDQRDYLVKYAIKGIPIEIRGRFQQYYSALSNDFPDYPNPCFHQIEIDLKRTFPEDEYFKLPGTIASMRRILVAYTKRNPVVGYSQGMNFILGRLIKFLTETEAFWVFTMLIESVLPIDYFCQFIGVEAESWIYKQLIKEQLPHIHQKFEELIRDYSDFDPRYLFLNWFVCLFSDKLSEDVNYLTTKIIIEDIFLLMENHQDYVYSAEKLLYLAQYGTKDFKVPKQKEILKLRQYYSQIAFEKQHIIKQRNDSHIIFDDLLLTEEKRKIQISINKQNFYNKFYLLTGLSKLRTCDQYKNREEIFKNLDANQSVLSEQTLNTRDFESQAVHNYKCDCSWPICLYDFTFKQIYPQFFCFKTAEDIHIVPDHFSTQKFDQIVMKIRSDSNETVMYRKNSQIDECDDEVPQHMIVQDDGANFENNIRQSFKRTSDTLHLDVKHIPNSLCKQLLVYRGDHYCNFPQFSENFSTLFRNDNTELIDNDLVNGKGLLDQIESYQIMNEFVNSVRVMQMSNKLFGEFGSIRRQNERDIMRKSAQKLMPKSLKNSKISQTQSRNTSSLQPANRVSKNNSKTVINNSRISVKQSHLSQNRSSNGFELPDELKEFGIIKQLETNKRNSRKISNIFSSSKDSIKLENRQSNRLINKALNRISPQTQICGTGSGKNSDSKKRDQVVPLKKRPKSQLLSPSSSKARLSNEQQKYQQKSPQFVSIVSRDDLTKFLNPSENTVLPFDQFEVLKRLTIKELLQRLDPDMVNENLEIMKKSKNIIFDGIFEDE